MIQPWWPRWIGMKWGYAYHTSVLWAARGMIPPAVVAGRWGADVSQPVDVIVVYREYVVSDLSEPQLARSIVSLTPKEDRKYVQRYYATPSSIFGIDGSENTIVDQMSPIFREARMPTPEYGDEDLVGGWRLVFNCIRRARILAGGESLTRDQLAEGPCLFIGAECSSLRDAIPTLTRFNEDSELVSQVKRSAESYDDTSDACADALRILCKSMLSARPDAPAAVRRRELWDSVEDPTSRGMRIAQFDAKEKQNKVIRRKRWRP